MRRREERNVAQVENVVVSSSVSNRQLTFSAAEKDFTMRLLACFDLKYLIV